MCSIELYSDNWRYLHFINDNIMLLSIVLNVIFKFQIE